MAIGGPCMEVVMMNLSIIVSDSMLFLFLCLLERVFRNWIDAPKHFCHLNRVPFIVWIVMFSNCDFKQGTSSVDVFPELFWHIGEFL